MLTMVATRLGPALARKAPGFFKARDKAPVVLRVVFALAIPLVMAIAMGQSADTTFNSMQVVIVTTMCTSFLALIPRSGTLGRTTPYATTIARSAFRP